MQNQIVNKSLIIIFIIIVFIILGGITLGFFYSRLPGHNPPKNKQSCESVDGQWSDEQNICFLSYKKSGETCTDGGQCKSGVCFPPILTEKQKINLNNSRQQKQLLYEAVFCLFFCCINIYEMIIFNYAKSNCK